MKISYSSYLFHELSGQDHICRQNLSDEYDGFWFHFHVDKTIHFNGVNTTLSYTKHIINHCQRRDSHYIFVFVKSFIFGQAVPSINLYWTLFQRPKKRSLLDYFLLLKLFCRARRSFNLNLNLLFSFWPIHIMQVLFWSILIYPGIFVTCRADIYFILFLFPKVLL